MIKKRIKDLRKKFNKLGIDGYVIPKNDEFFSENTEKNRLRFISNFSGSAGFAIILKKKIICLLIVDIQFKLNQNQVNILR